MINKDKVAAAQVRAQFERLATRATLTFLQAPALDSLADGIRYGGRQYDTHGHIAAPDTVSVKRDPEGADTFTLPNASAAVLTFTR